MAEWLKRIGEELTKDRGTLADNLNRLMLGSPAIDDDMIEELEAILIQADLGVGVTTRILDRLQEKNNLTPGYERSEVKTLVHAGIIDIQSARSHGSAHVLTTSTP